MQSQTHGTPALDRLLLADSCSPIRTARVSSPISALRARPGPGGGRGSRANEARGVCRPGRGGQRGCKHRFDLTVGRTGRRNGSSDPSPRAGFLCPDRLGWPRLKMGRLRWRQCPRVRASFGYSRRSRRRRNGTRMLQSCWRYSSGLERGTSPAAPRYRRDRRIESEARTSLHLALRRGGSRGSARLRERVQTSLGFSRSKVGQRLSLGRAHCAAEPRARHSRFYLGLGCLRVVRYRER